MQSSTASSRRPTVEALRSVRVATVAPSWSASVIQAADSLLIQHRSRKASACRTFANDWRRSTVRVHVLRWSRSPRMVRAPRWRFPTNSKVERAMPRAVIAEDEPLLRAQLRARLVDAWPELDVVGEAE